ncbi:sulfite exporter TauE/SafE family protein [Ktedonosporobacter rubrisoli]|uniref:Probable membrane transporter protein n=1 Tax=Ktedonosporobacter rubrisoli TaxID=2509675 RepID=A0A4P6JS97_KTERU|nr:sulfite exporter TauE/SafE family protein [Ktedonosporobacter rubrisoli]QBD78205.1 sulfite exporter TauE/SafE family protein [Ktedonosporobacter rubrisoli]
MDYRISLVGLFIGILVGLTGMGGGSLLAPIMILFFKIPPVWAVGTDIAYSTITKSVGSLVHIRQKNVNFKVAFLLAAGSIPATLLSVTLVQSLHKQYSHLIDTFILHALGVTLLLVAILLVTKPIIMKWLERRNFEAQKRAALRGQPLGEKTGRWEKYYRPAFTILVGAVVGFLVGLTSVGSGTLIIAAVAFMFPKLGPKELVGTDIFQAFMLLASGSIGYLTSGTVNWPMVFLLLLGSIPGVLLGSKLSKYIPDRYMRPLIATVLAVSGFKLI